MDGKGPRLLDLIPKERFWVGKEACNEEKNGGFEEKLELRLGLPGEEEKNGEKQSVKSTFSRVYSANVAKRVFLGSVEANKGKGIIKEKTTEARNENASMADTSSQTRNTTAPVVGWPPIRSFRKNLSNSTNPKQTQNLGTEKKIEGGKKGLFVKINMDGVPIGRKIDLKAYNGYEELSLAVDLLFKGLLAAQRDPLETSSEKNTGVDQREITGLVNGNGEYTLVYEDEEGDRVLVGDVPWKMFVSTAKRLRVLKTSDLPVSSLSTTNRKRMATEC
ncbi:hypothetical protein LUZ60_012419 [Juncus effusus]|nr:hypothetical protein LUZ60_012419 [Juncus effusus]